MRRLGTLGVVAISDKIRMIEDRDLLSVKTISTRRVTAFSSSEMEELYAALKAKDIY
jgi:hypothetical protein